MKKRGIGLGSNSACVFPVPEQDMQICMFLKFIACLQRLDSFRELDLKKDS